MEHSQELKRSLGPLMLWGLGVGYVISGMYFGWNLGLAEGGTLGMAVATLFIIVLYVSFTFSYMELACAIPKAGGAADYACAALGRRWGFVVGMAQNIEFIFAPPAIAFAIGAYLANWIPGTTTTTMAVAAYLLFTVINIIGVKTAALFELLMTAIAALGLLVFSGVSLPYFEWQHVTANALPKGWGGAFAAIPFAIWFFLAIEGVANVAEETINPQRNILLGFGLALLTLVVLCLVVFTSSIGIAGWEAVVYPAHSTQPSDSPLPLVLGHIVSDNDMTRHVLIATGVFGLMASFHGIMLAGGRAVFEFSRLGFAPAALGTIHRRCRTPVKAFLFNTGLGIIILFSGRTGEVIVIACFGALTLYIVSMLAFFKLRQDAPHMDRPFKTPCYPATPALALLTSIVSLISLSIYHVYPGLIFYLLLGLTFAGFRFCVEDKRPV